MMRTLTSKRFKKNRSTNTLSCKLIMTRKTQRRCCEKTLPVNFQSIRWKLCCMQRHVDVSSTYIQAAPTHRAVIFAQPLAAEAVDPAGCSVVLSTRGPSLTPRGSQSPEEFLQLSIHAVVLHIHSCRASSNTPS